MVYWGVFTRKDQTFPIWLTPHNFLKYKEKSQTTRRKYQTKRKKSDSIFKLIKDMRSNLCRIIRGQGYTKKSSCNDIYGCSWEQLKNHIESQFKDGMSWENRGEWHIDHIIPLVNATTEEQLIRLNHFTNLRPLWAKENLTRRKKPTYNEIN